MKNLLVGRRGEVTPRDEEVMRDLFFLDRATLDQLAVLHFPTCVKKRAYNRLRQLRNKGRLANEVIGVDGKDGLSTLNFFSLTQEARAAVADTLASEGLPPERLHATRELGKNNPESTNLKPLSPLRAEHTEKVSRLYMLLKGGLEKALGGAGTAWLWRSERRATRSYDRADGRRYYRPDAELILYPPLPLDAPLDTLPQPFHLFIEVQTANSRASSSEIARKVADHQLATTLPSFPPPERRALVFAGETRAHLDAAVETANRYGLPLISDDLHGSSRRIIELAQTLSPASAPSAKRPTTPRDITPNPASVDGSTPQFGPPRPLR